MSKPLYVQRGQLSAFIRDGQTLKQFEQLFDAVSNIIAPPLVNTPTKPGDLVFQATSDHTLTIKVVGSDGIVRSVALTLA